MSAIKELHNDYIKVAWRYMITKGGAFNGTDGSRDWNLGNYYGSGIDTDYKLTTSVAKKLSKGVGIDWAKMSEPDTGQVNRFNGTFTSTQLLIPYFKGTLHLTDGSNYEWGCVNGIEDEGFSLRNFADTLNHLLSIANETDEGAAESLAKTVAKYEEKPQYWNHRSTI